MLLRQYIIQLETIFGNMVFTESNKIAPTTLEKEFPKWKQRAMYISYYGTKQLPYLPAMAGNRFINPQNYVKTKWTYDKSIQPQGANYVLFSVEPAVSLGDDKNGFVFVGDDLSGTPFIQLKSPNDYGVYKTAGLIDQSDVCFNVSGNEMKIWGNTQVKTVYADYIPSDVTNVDVYRTALKTYVRFDPEVDEYPISDDVWFIMKAMAVWELTPPNLRPADYRNDGTPLIEKQTNA